MAKKPAPSSARRPVAPRVFLGGVDPIALVELLDNRFTDPGDPDGSPYQRLYRESKETFLARAGQGAVHFADLLVSVDVSTGVEEAIRRAGFLQGFECCRQLLLGELDLAALKGGAE